MNKNRFYLCQFPALFLVASLWLAPSPAARAQTLYNAYLGTPPQSQGWSFIPEGTYYETVTDNSVLLDTTTTGVTEAGWGEITASDLNHTNGFSLLFGAMLNSETHTSTNRAGFSLIVLRDDTNGIELAFWTNEIFAQSDSPLFTQAESASFTTTGSFVNYTLTMLATNYILLANGAPILAGPVRNYTAFSGFPDPYSTPDFIFFGDDTTSGAASVQVRGMTLLLPPSLTMPAPGIVAWTGVSNQTYTVQASTNLKTWNTVGVAASSSSSFSFTNGSSASNQFFRVALP
jgi:hypothetical protein